MHPIHDRPSDIPAAFRLILASSSPRRRELLALLQRPFEIITAETDESAGSYEAPERLVRRLSLGKAAAVADSVGPGALVLGADTVVALDGRILGKPRDEHEARAMLVALRGRTHHVFTGVALIDTTSGRDVCAIAATVVLMRDYTDPEIDAYVAGGDPFDKAGAYAIQHAGFHPVEALTGCYANVMGLPLCHVVVGMQTLGAVPSIDPAQFCCHLENESQLAVRGCSPTCSSECS